MEGSFLYYAPDPQGRQQKQHGHHGQFLPYVSASPQLLAPTPVHFPSQLVLGGRGVPLTINPSASPFMDSYIPHNLCSESAANDILFNPATPPLTHSGLSTPSIPYAMSTPISNHGWSAADEPAITTVAPFEIETPLEYMPGLIAIASPPPSISLNNIHCPALSPCSSQDSFNAEIDFCDPRNLTIQSPSPVDVKPELSFPVMPSLSNDDEQLLFGDNLEQYLPLNATGKVNPYITGDFNEELSDLDTSEDDFIQSFHESCMSSAKRMRFDEDSDNDQLPSPPLSASSSRQGSLVPAKTPKARKVLKKKIESSESSSDEMTDEEDRLRSFRFGAYEDSDHSCDSPCSPKPNGIPINPNVIRRGRKQSLTEDPSKTFVCHLCGRRFRRQEHLKRHFRSLHTEDKPFSCNECGKRFSRSDNLTQHSRIHGTGSVLLGVLTENDVHVMGAQYNMEEDTLLMTPQETLGIMVDAFAATSCESKDTMSSEDKKARRKRKRSDE